MFIVGVRVLRDKEVPWQNIGLLIRYVSYNTQQNKIKTYLVALTLYLKEKPFNTFAKGADPDVVALLLCLLMENRLDILTDLISQHLLPLISFKGLLNVNILFIR